MVSGIRHIADQQLHSRRHHGSRTGQCLGGARRARGPLWLRECAASCRSAIRTPTSEMILCLVTDRRRLGAATGARPDRWIEALQEQVRAAAVAGVDLIQLREPDLEAGELTRLTRSLMELVDGTATRVLVNDRVDVALAAGASGVQLKERSVLPSDV